ncbi:hypothetical protein HY504_03650 [Candidatus Wolfebacteria bacterium]|nr:hypothetical protein [Candidatus Wolfebacteria bacterium]
MKKDTGDTSGQIMLLTVLVISASMFVAATVAGYLVLLRIRQSTDIANSTKAIYAAEAGVEWRLYAQFGDRNRPLPEFENGASVTVSSTPDGAKSIGSSNKIFRALRLSF